MALGFVSDYYQYLLTAELQINEWAQESLSSAQPFLRLASVFLSPGNLFNLLLPFLGIFGQDLLTGLVCALSLASTVGSLTKWIYADWRPLWWLREVYATSPTPHSLGVALQSHELSCETSGGLPCAHSLAWTALLLALAGPRRTKSRLLRLLVVCCVLCMWLSRLYLATEYLHQCLLGSYLALRLQGRLPLSLRRRRAVLLVLLLGGGAVAIYFLKLQLDLDPHWSVRQAFKWCPEPGFMRHESSPIFLLARDLGNLMGVALAMPLNKRTTSDSRCSERFAGIAILELINHVLRMGTPKQHGRFFFLAFEFGRNAIHSLMLIKFLPKLLNWKSSLSRV